MGITEEKLTEWENLINSFLDASKRFWDRDDPDDQDVIRDYRRIRDAYETEVVDGGAIIAAVGEIRRQREELVKLTAINLAIETVLNAAVKKGSYSLGNNDELIVSVAVRTLIDLGYLKYVGFTSVGGTYSTVVSHYEPTERARVFVQQQQMGVLPFEGRK